MSELLVSSLVLTIFMMLALGTIVPAIKVTRQSEESLDSQREVVLAFDRLTSEMSLLDRASLTVAPDTFSYLSDQEFRGTNSAIPDADMADMGLSHPEKNWTKWVLLRHRDGKVLRREYPYDKGRRLYALLETQLPLLGDAPGVQEKVFARNVELFEPTAAGSSRLRLKIRSVFRGTTQPRACELNLQIQMRGGN